MKIKCLEGKKPRHQKVKGYLRIFGRYVSQKLLFTVLAAILALAAAYAGAVHVPVMRAWYSFQKPPEFKLDSPYLMAYNGRARLLLPDGSMIYEGDITNATAEGEGKLYLKGKLLYEGQFGGSKYNGKGKLYTESGELLYSGEFVDNKYSGKGILYGADGVIYDGMFENGEFSGRGKLRQGAAYYEGDFAAGLYEGSGRLYTNGALLYEGQFIAGLYSGDGVEYNPATGFKVFEGKYLEGKRQEAGFLYDEKGRPILPLPELFDPLTQIKMPYEDVCAKLMSAGADYQVLPLLDNRLLLKDESGGVVYAFDTSPEGEPHILTNVYYYGLTAVHGVVVGSDISGVELTPIKPPAEKPSKQVNIFLLALSNAQWGRDVLVDNIKSVSYKSDDLRITAYYLPPTVVAEGFSADVGEENKEEVKETGTILFVSVERYEGGGK